MSGIIGILNTDGAPIDRRLLTDLTDALRFRGPDAQRAWIDGSVGFGHTLFATTEEARTEQQPCTLDGDVWIAADARIDGRDDLVRALAARGRDASAANDAQLVLHAYAAWGDACVDHLIGDFAFAIWDRPRRRLFCARDQFGVKPFYYAQRGDVLVVSNTLDCIRLHPAISGALNDSAIADFLLFQATRTLDTTAFADIQRLPGGHTLVWSTTGLQRRRYWSLPLDGDIRFKRSADYVDRFTELLTASVRDRLRTRRVGIMMSGGLDSTAIAATVQRVSSEEGSPFDLRASAIVYDRLIPDQERQYSTLAARALGIPIDYLAADEARPFDEWDRPDLRTPEPTDEPFHGMLRDYYRGLAAHSRVALTGWDGDTLFAEYPSRHFSALARSGQVGRLAGALLTYAWTFRTAPPIGVRTTLRRWLGHDDPPPAFPAWLNADLVARLDLRRRWKETIRQTARPQALRPRGETVLLTPLWLSLFERYDAGTCGALLEFRHPFADIRVVSYALAIPVVPWCCRKTLLREAMRGLLPEPIRTRRKAALAGEPMLEFARQPEQVDRLERLDAVPELTQYVDVAALPPLAGQHSLDRVYLRLRPLSLNYWLRGLTLPNGGDRHGHQQIVEVGH